MNISAEFNGGKNYDYMFGKMKEIGYYGLDMSVGAENILSDEFTKTIREKYKSIKNHGLEVCQTHLAYHPGHLPHIGDGTYKAYEEVMLPKFIRGIELSGELNARTAVIHLYDHETREESRKGNIELISKLIPHLEKNNVILSIENIFGDGDNTSDIYLSTAEDLLYYTDYFESPYVGACLDTGHALLRGQNPVEMLKKISNNLTALHINTNSGDHDLHCVPYCVSYMESVDWEEFVKVLKTIDYKGSFNMELNVPAKLNDKARLAFFTMAYEVANDLLK